jgi:hypothetical protein
MLTASRRFGLRKTAVGLRPLCGFSPPHFYKPWNAPRSFIGLAKTSYTAGTLCDMPQMVTEYIKHIRHNKIIRLLNTTETISNNNSTIGNQG